jgi:hypothetical protein
VRTIGAERPDTEPAVILGVDTHLDFHVAVAVDDLGRRLGESSAPTTVKGYEGILCWAEKPRQGSATYICTVGGGNFTSVSSCGILSLPKIERLWKAT